MAYVFLPYWAFDIEGYYRPGTTEQNSTKPASQDSGKKSNRRQKNTISKLYYRPQQPSSQGTTPVQDPDLSEVESITSDLEDEEGTCSQSLISSNMSVIFDRTLGGLERGLEGRWEVCGLVRGLKDSTCARRFLLKRVGVGGSMTDAIDSMVVELSNAPICGSFSGG